MTIERQDLWDAAPQSTRDSARSVMIGASTAWWLIFIPKEQPHNGKSGYFITACGPIEKHTPIVATNLSGQF